MASEQEARIIGDFAEDIASELGEAAIIARNASGLSGQDWRSVPSARYSTSRP